MVQDVDDKFFERADVSTSRGGCLSSMAMFPNPLNLSLNLLIYRHDYDVAWGALDVVWRHRV